MILPKRHVIGPQNWRKMIQRALARPWAASLEVPAAIKIETWRLPEAHEFGQPTIWPSYMSQYRRGRASAALINATIDSKAQRGRNAAPGAGAAPHAPAHPLDPNITTTALSHPDLGPLLVPPLILPRPLAFPLYPPPPPPLVPPRPVPGPPPFTCRSSPVLLHLFPAPPPIGPPPTFPPSPFPDPLPPAPQLPPVPPRPPPGPPGAVTAPLPPRGLGMMVPPPSLPADGSSGGGITGGVIASVTYHRVTPVGGALKTGAPPTSVTVHIFTQQNPI